MQATHYARMLATKHSLTTHDKSVRSEVFDLCWGRTSLTMAILICSSVLNIQKLRKEKGTQNVVKIPEDNSWGRRPSQPVSRKISCCSRQKTDRSRNAKFSQGESKGTN